MVDKKFDVDIEITVSGFGRKIVSVTGIDAADMFGAIDIAQRDLVTVRVVRAVQTDLVMTEAQDQVTQVVTNGIPTIAVPNG